MIQSPYCNIHIFSDYSFNNTHRDGVSLIFISLIVSDDNIVVNFVTFQTVSVKRTTTAIQRTISYVFIVQRLDILQLIYVYRVINST